MRAGRLRVALAQFFVHFYSETVGHAGNVVGDDDFFFLGQKHFLKAIHIKNMHEPNWETKNMEPENLLFIQMILIPFLINYILQDFLQWGYILQISQENVGKLNQP